MNDLLKQLDELVALRAAAGKPGPWTWDFRPESHTISLMNGWDTVLDTKRWGSQGATIRMEDPEAPGLLLPLHVDAVPHEGRAHHKNWALTANPKRAAAAFIAAAGSFDFAALRAALTPPAAAPAAGGAGEASNEREIILPSNIKDMPDMSETEKDEMINQAVHAAGHCLLLAFFACKIPNYISGRFQDEAGNSYELKFGRKGVLVPSLTSPLPATPETPGAPAAAAPGDAAPTMEGGRNYGLAASWPDTLSARICPRG